MDPGTGIRAAVTARVGPRTRYVAPTAGTLPGRVGHVAARGALSGKERRDRGNSRTRLGREPAIDALGGTAISSVGTHGHTFIRLGFVAPPSSEVQRESEERTVA